MIESSPVQSLESPLDATETMAIIGINPTHLANPKTFAQVKDIVDFFKGAEDKRMVLSRLTRGVNDDERVQKISEYIKLRKEFAEVDKKHRDLKSLISRYE